MAAGEAENPRRNMPRAFYSVFYRLTAFFVVGSLCIGIVIPYSNPDLRNALSNARPGAGSSPYVIAMEHLQIKVLPHIVNALILTAVFSAGNSIERPGDLARLLTTQRILATFLRWRHPTSVRFFEEEREEIDLYEETYTQK
ncbi:hypothetical protein H0H81_008187 [Sphagnurus paluster]|uniref:Amino acid permease/ SLC12A domain-containing protein n=1 Tax=Sphagnurus paluster TaxID=117069 RepID=A0A9P7G1W5_9AGAR|nr:hypothetical protein H0H81_008187 [Sphagnurus paluster]